MSYKVIFTDFSMPIMDGIESTREIRKWLEQEHRVARDDQPMILGVTGHVHDDFRIQGCEAGMDDVISKPVYYDVLLKWLRDLDLIQS